MSRGEGRCGSIVGLWLLAVAPSCSVSLSFGLDREESASACNDDVDNDGDGVIDCADPGCWGVAAFVCDENSEVGLCRDGFDNDLDGRADQFELNCSLPKGWASQLTPCASVEGTRVPSLAATRLAWTGQATFAVDPTDRFSDGVLSFPPGSGARLDVPITGGLQQLDLSMSVRASGAAAIVVELRLIPQGGPVGAEPAFRLDFGSADRGVEARVGSRTSASDPQLIEAVTADWIDLQLTTSADSVEISLGQTSIDHRLPDSERIASSGAFELHIRRDDREPTSVTVGDLVLRVPERNPCGVAVPSEGASEPGRLWTMAVSPDRFCGVYEELGSSELVVLTAENRSGLNTPRLPDFVDRGGWKGSWQTADLREPALDWDAARGQYVGAAVRYEDDLPRDVHLISTSDCSTWRDEGPAQPGHLWGFGGRAGSLLGYVVQRQSGDHWLVSVNSARSDEPGEWLEARASPNGTAGDFELVRLRGADDGPSLRLSGAGNQRPRVTVQYAGEGELLLLRGMPGGDLRDFFFNAPVVEPSGLAGTFDRFAIEQGVAWLPEPASGELWNGYVFYTARGCADCDAHLGTAVLQPTGNEIVP